MGVNLTLLLLCSILSISSTRAQEIQMVKVPSDLPKTERFSVFVETDSWKDLKYRNNETGRVKDTGIDNPMSFTWKGEYLAYVERDFFQDLEYINMISDERKDTGIDAPSSFGLYGHYLFYVTKRPFDRLEVLDMKTGKRRSTGISSPTTLFHQNGIIVTDQGRFKL